MTFCKEAAVAVSFLCTSLVNGTLSPMLKYQYAPSYLLSAGARTNLNVPPWHTMPMTCLPLHLWRIWCMWPLSWPLYPNMVEEHGGFCKPQTRSCFR